MKKIIQSIKKPICSGLFLVLAFQNLSLIASPAALLAAGLDKTISATLLAGDVELTSLLPLTFIPTPEEARVTVTLTGYSSTPDQTDDTPFTTASGKRVRDGIIAANFLKFGTKVKIPELFGDRIFIVEDRMARRYFHRVDVWFPDRVTALKFGKREAEIVIVEG